MNWYDIYSIFPKKVLVWGLTGATVVIITLGSFVAKNVYNNNQKQRQINENRIEQILNKQDIFLIKLHQKDSNDNIFKSHVISRFGDIETKLNTVSAKVDIVGSTNKELKKRFDDIDLGAKQIKPEVSIPSYLSPLSLGFVSYRPEFLDSLTIAVIKK